MYSREMVFVYTLIQPDADTADIDLESLLEDLRVWELEQSRFAEHWKIRSDCADRGCVFAADMQLRFQDACLWGAVLKKWLYFYFEASHALYNSRQVKLYANKER